MPDPVTHSEAVLRRGPVADLDPRTLYLLAKLRQDVFSLEQGATDPDLDGRDLEGTTTLVWIEVAGPGAEAAGLEREPAAHTRVLREADGTLRIGRVAVRAAERRHGFGGRVMRESLALAREIDPQAEVHVDAQAYLERWYQGLGFEPVGALFLEAGIEHVPMVLRPRSD
ncbi:GNAT family N-acetyltransferase [Brachybacterium sacelli]|uniref:ElaA protein n=1 Tax=Brachybacterium sacelli TaxID=173364 RepID=A0ABS4X1G0_9MICO|nr:GNAT family N-acetyltransferase [Brachybacterium sacelli]MBP2382288.1 ElaA protein [Brachybacterium sacelli]